jgi:pilus assembly protein Flp/PilA
MTVHRFSVKRVLRRLSGDVRGATAIEYGLIAALIVLAMVGALNATARTTVGMWNNVSDKVAAAIGGP